MLGSINQKLQSVEARFEPLSKSLKDRFVQFNRNFAMFRIWTFISSQSILELYFVSPCLQYYYEDEEGYGESHDDYGEASQPPSELPGEYCTGGPVLQDNGCEVGPVFLHCFIYPDDETGVAISLLDYYPYI